MDGFALIDKPAGPTSFSVVKKLCAAVGAKKGGHGGTLDPLATGLLVCAFNGATRLLPYCDLEPKEYLFTVRYGTATDTLDTEGAVTATGGLVGDAGVIRAALPEFVGDIMQTPPRYSAVKIGGVAAHRLARQNREFSPTPRRIHIHEYELISFDLVVQEAQFRVVCSTGTYVRVLAADLAEKIGTVGHCRAIRRTKAGPCTVSAAIPLATALEPDGCPILPLSTFFSRMPARMVTSDEAVALRHGREIASGESTGETVFCWDGLAALVAVAHRTAGDTLHPEVVLAPCNT